MSEPNKYITTSGIRKVNPEWQAAHPSTIPFANRVTALPVVSAPPASADDDEEIVVTATPLYEVAVEQYHTVVEPEIFIQQGETTTTTTDNGGGGGGLDELNQVLAKYEVPAGLLSKLLELSEFQIAEFIVDDSGSMALSTDARGLDGRVISSRWYEARDRILQMMEIMAYVVSPPVTIRFLNRPDVIELKRLNGESPKDFLHRSEVSLKRAFARNPAGSTPALEAIEASLARYDSNLPVLRYFLGDGVPNGRDVACRKIEQVLIHRLSPETNPFTFFSCTNVDSDTEWMKECEEKATYCSEFDDYGDESQEILKDQGKAFPYSYGLHLVGQLVAAFNPDDLDAMDESVPFTKQTLENLMGYQTSPEEYKYYFDSFVAAQRQLRDIPPFQRTFINKLPRLYEQFATASLAKDISAVAEYKQTLQSKERQEQMRSSPQQVENAECCVIL